METTSKSFDGSHDSSHSGQTETALTRLLFELRTAQELSLFELANRTGINRSTLMRIQNGTSIRPDTQTIRALAKALGVEPEDFWDAIWQDRSKQPASKAEVLPSPSVYLRSKYRLSQQQAKQAEDYLAPFSAVGEVLFFPWWGDVEVVEDGSLCGGEAVESDAVVGVGESESLERGEGVSAGG